MLLVIGAMSEELAACQKLWAWEQRETPLGPIFKSSSHDLLLCSSGIGLVNAGARLSQCLTLYPEINQIIVLGTAGAIIRQLHQGDAVVINHTIYGSANVQAFGYQLGQIPQMPPVYEANQHYLKHLEQLITPLVNNLQLVNCASMDVFIDSGEQVYNLIKPLPIPIQIVDMEMAAYYQVAFRYHVPIVGLKIVSDSLEHDKNGAQTFDEFLPKASILLAQFLAAIISNPTPVNETITGLTND